MPDHPAVPTQVNDTTNLIDSFTFVACLTLLACVLTGIAWWNPVPFAIGTIVAAAYTLAPLQRAVSARQARAP